jgi:hypothetical protein
MITGMHAIVFSPQAEQQGRRGSTGRLRSGLGLLAAIRLPDGSEFPIYQPRHPLPSRS